MSLQFQKNRLLSEFSTFGIGGPIALFAEVRSAEEMVEGYAWAKANQTPVLVIGKGSNCLFNDAGFSGLVLLNKIDFCEIHNLDVHVGSGYSFSLLGVQTARRGLSGLEFASGIPATVGGATYINLHGANKYWSDYLVEAEIIDQKNRVKTVALEYFGYDYDQSTLKTSGDVVLSATLQLRRGPAEEALKIAKFWQAKKSHQPQRSLGCIFQNLSQTEQKQLNLPTPSIGYLIDKQLNLKGTQIGQAWIPQKHAGFVENLGGATATQVLQLIKLVQTKAKEQLGLDLKLEIVPWLN